MEQDEILGQNHDVYHEFPEYREQIDNLKSSNEEFSSLFDEYTKLNREVIRIEQHVEARSHEYFEEVKKRRLQAKDRIYEFLHG